MASRQKGGEGGEERAKRSLTIFSMKDIGETIRRSAGNAITKALVEAVREEGMEAEVEPVPERRGFRIRAKKGEAYIEEEFREDEQGLQHLGSRLSIDSLRLGWFRKALAKVLGLKGDKELYEAFFKKEFFETAWSPRYHIAIGPQKIFDERTEAKLAEARRAVTAIRPGEEDYLRYFTETFSGALPAGFAVPSPYAPVLLPLDPRRLKSMVERDEAYKKALKAAAVAAKKIIGDAEKDPGALADRIGRTGGK